MKRRLFVIHDVVYPDTDGGKKIVLGRILYESRFFDVDVLLYNYNGSSIEALKLFLAERNINLIVIERRYNNLNKFFSIFSSRPYYETLISSDIHFTASLKAVISKVSYDYISFETIFFYETYLTIEQDLYCSIDFLLHNVESSFFFDLSRTTKSLVYKCFYFLESLKVKNLEYLISKNKQINLIFLSKPDLERYKSIGLFTSSKNSLNHNEIFVRVMKPRSVNSTEPFFLFPGSVSFPPNFHGLFEILSIYESSSLNIPIYVTGPTRLKLFFENKFKKVKFTGFVNEEELYRLYSECTAVISPLFKGSGVKVKNLEVIQLGVPLVATRFSMLGVPVNLGDKVSVTDDSASDFVKCLVELYS